MKRLWTTLLLLLSFVSLAQGQALDRTHVAYTNPLQYGATCVLATLNSAVTALGSTKNTLILTRTDRAKVNCTWAITDNITFNANTTVYIPTGVTLSVSSTKTATFNGLVIVDDFASLTGAGTYVFNKQEIADIRLYGATADSSSDDDRAAIQRAINSTAQQIYIPKGVFDITCSGNVGVSMLSNKIMYGPGTLKWKTGVANSCRMIQISDVDNVKIKDITLDGNGNNNAAGEQNHGVNITGENNNITLQGMTIHDMQGDSIYIGSTGASDVTKNVKIIDNYIYNLGRQGYTIASGGVNQILIKGNTCEVGTYVTTSTSNGNCIHFETDVVVASVSHDIVIEGNTNIGNGISITAADTVPWNNITITGNTVTYNISTSKDILSVLNSRNVSITGNTLYGVSGTPSSAILVQDPGPTSETENVVISGNTIFCSACTNDGILVFGSAGVSLKGNVTIANNSIFGSGSSSNDDCIEVSTTVRNIVISGNNLSDCQEAGIAIRGGQYFTVVGNIVHNFTTQGILAFTNPDTVGQGTITGNVVYNDSITTQTGVSIPTTEAGILVFGNNLKGNNTPISIASGATDSIGLFNYTAAGSPTQTSKADLLGFRRLRFNGGTAHVSGDYALSAGWGDAASVAVTIGNDTRGRIVVTSEGTGQGANPSVTLTFKDGAFPATPIPIVSRAGGSQLSVPFIAIGISATQAVFTFIGTPVAAETYTFQFIMVD